MKKQLLVFAATVCSLGWACSDFSGKWKGQCSDKDTGKVFDMKLEYTQKACESLTAGPYTLEFGKTQTFNIPASEKEYELVTHTAWDKKEEAARIDLDLSGRMAGQKEVIEAVKSVMTFTLNDGVLVATTVADMTLPSVKHSEQECVMRRE